eukprot:5566050-Heterocapsa_arctica.AAC.1
MVGTQGRGGPACRRWRQARGSACCAVGRSRRAGPALVATRQSWQPRPGARGGAARRAWEQNDDVQQGR